MQLSLRMKCRSGHNSRQEPRRSSCRSIFVDQVVQATRTDVTDVHCRTFSDGFDPFEHLDARLAEPLPLPSPSGAFSTVALLTGCLFLVWMSGFFAMSIKTIEGGDSSTKSPLYRGFQRTFDIRSADYDLPDHLGSKARIHLRTDLLDVAVISSFRQAALLGAYEHPDRDRSARPRRCAPGPRRRSPTSTPAPQPRPLAPEDRSARAIVGLPHRSIVPCSPSCGVSNGPDARRYRSPEGDHPASATSAPLAIGTSRSPCARPRPRRNGRTSSDTAVMNTCARLRLRFVDPFGTTAVELPEYVVEQDDRRLGALPSQIMELRDLQPDQKRLVLPLTCRMPRLRSVDHHCRSRPGERRRVWCRGAPPSSRPPCDRSQSASRNSLSERLLSRIASGM